MANPTTHNYLGKLMKTIPFDSYYALSRLGAIVFRCQARMLLVIGCMFLSLGAVAKIPVGAEAPDFALDTLSGSKLRLQDQRGRIVMINFWASWCAPCRLEMPHLIRLHDKYHAAGFTLLGVNIDDDRKVAAAMAERIGVKFPVLLDTGKKVTGTYDMGAMPATLILDRKGRVRFVHLGYEAGLEATYEKQVKDLLKE